MRIWCDTETFSTKPLAHGSWAYAEQAEVMMFTWAVDDGPVDLWDVTEDPALPARLGDALDAADEIWFSNGTGFDWPVLFYSRPDIFARMPQHKWRDVLVQAYSHALPGSLDKLGRVLGLPDDKIKDKRGKALIQLFCKPRKDGGRNTRLTHPAEWEEFKVYARQDIVVMREAQRRMPMWNYRERDVRTWLCDWRTNARGIAVDMDLAVAAVGTAREARQGLSAEMREATEGEVGAATQRDALLHHLANAHGVELPDLTKSTVADLLETDELPKPVRRLLELRQQASLNSPAKFTRVINGANSDNRIRGCMQFRGAGRSGRAAHRLLQPGNMARPSTSAHHIEALIECTKVRALPLVHDKPMEALRDQVRGVIVAGPKRKLVVADLSNIEGRMMAWLAGEDWKLRAFREFDAGRGHDLYILAYASSFAVRPETVPKKGLERQIGKVCIAAGQRVLTHVGLVPIENVTRDMQVWDGVEWVKHEGVLFSGMKEVMTYQGLTATPTHEVFIDGETKIPLALAATRGQDIVQSGAGRTPIRVVGSDRAGASLHQGVAPAGLAAQQESGIAQAEGRDDARADPGGRLESGVGEAEELARYAGKVAVYDIVNAGPRRRFTVEGKLVSNCELMLQYAGGVGAFVTGAVTYRIDLEAMAEQAWPTIPGRVLDEAGSFLEWKYEQIPAEKKDVALAREEARIGLSERVFIVCDSLKRLWRAAHPEVVGFWADIKSTLQLSMANPGVTFPCRRLKFRRDGQWLRIGLPSGRALCYASPEIDEGSGQFSYFGIDKGKWKKIRSYAGKVAENVTQAAAADQMFGPYETIEAAGYLPVLHVHDEWVTETPDSADFTPETLDAMMCADLGWNKGLPLAAAGFETYRYKKE